MKGHTAMFAILTAKISREERERRLRSLSDKIESGVQAAMGHSPCPSCGDVGPHGDNGVHDDLTFCCGSCGDQWIL